MAKAKKEEIAEVEETEEEVVVVNLVEQIDWNDDIPEIGKSAYTDSGNGFICGRGEYEGREYFLLEHKTEGHKFVKTVKATKFFVVDEHRKEKYEVDKTARTPSGNPSVSCGDDLAVAMKSLTAEELRNLAVENDLGDRWDAWAERHNFGMCRMHLGNVLRNRWKKGEIPVTIFTKTVEDAAEIRRDQIAREAEKIAAKQAAKEATARQSRAKATADAAKEADEELGDAAA